MEEWFNIYYFLVFVACFLLFMSELCKKQGGMCYTTKSDAATKTNPSRVFRVILCRVDQIGKRLVKPCKSVG
jgi:hypothetical protein